MRSCPFGHPPGGELALRLGDHLARRDVVPVRAAPCAHLLPSQISQTRAGAERRELPYNPDGEIAEAHFHWLWPTFTINVFPGRPNLGVLAFVPAGPGKTASVIDHFYGEDVTDDEIASIQEFGSQVGLEDQELVESIQRAADSGGLTEGRLMLSSEHLIQHFQRLVERALA